MLTKFPLTRTLLALFDSDDLPVVSMTGRLMTAEMELRADLFLAGIDIDDVARLAAGE